MTCTAGPRTRRAAEPAARRSATAVVPSIYVDTRHATPGQLQQHRCGPEVGGQLGSARGHEPRIGERPRCARSLQPGCCGCPLCYALVNSRLRSILCSPAALQINQGRPNTCDAGWLAFRVQRFSWACCQTRTEDRWRQGRAGDTHPSERQHFSDTSNASKSVLLDSPAMNPKCAAATRTSSPSSAWASR